MKSRSLCSCTTGARVRRRNSRAPSALPSTPRSDKVRSLLFRTFNVRNRTNCVTCLCAFNSPLSGWWRVISVPTLVLICLQVAIAQQPQTEMLTVEQAVAAAVKKYPSVRVSTAQVNAAIAGIRLARTAYLPRFDATAGVNRATRNNVLGLLLPSQVIAPISGPVLGTNGLGSAWGSTVGLLVSWEPFDFGLRQANVTVAEAGRARAEASVRRTRLDVATIAADSVLTLIAAEQTVIAAQA